MKGGEIMIEAIRNMGEYSLRQKGIDTKTNLIEILLHEPNSGGNYPKVYIINFDVLEDKIIYKNVSIEDASAEKKLQYLFREKANQGANYTPTAKIAGDTNEKIATTFENRITKWFKRLYEKQDAWFNRSLFFQQLYKSFIDDKQKIKNDFINARIEGTEGGFVTLVFHDAEGKKYLGDVRDFRDYLIEFSNEKYEEISGDGTCSLCQSQGHVYGNASPITFYTLDKPGYIAGGLRKEYGFRNFPLCLECVLQLEEGSACMKKFMDFKFAGIKYFLLPEFSIGELETVEETMQIYKNYHLDIKNGVSISQGQRISSDEYDILDLLQENNDSISLKFMFYVEQNAKFTILLLMEDILPSRLKRLFEAKLTAENHFIFKDQKFSAQMIKDIKFNFSVLKRFIPTIKSFLEIINKVFKGQKIDYELIISFFMAKIRTGFNETKYLKIDALQAFVCLLFLEQLELFLKRGGGIIHMENEQILENTGDVQSKVNHFFKEFSSTIDSAAKKAIFLTGVLTQHLLAIQNNDRGSTPFRSNLKGLKLKEADIKGLLPKIQQKLEEYKSNYYLQLEQIISQYFLEAGNNWGMSIDEINFYFVLGMNLNDAKSTDGQMIFKVNKNKNGEEVDVDE